MNFQNLEIHKEPRNINIKRFQMAEETICLEINEQHITKNMYSDTNSVEDANSLLKTTVAVLEDTDNGPSLDKGINEQSEYTETQTQGSDSTSPVKIRSKLQPLIDSDTSEDEADNMYAEIIEKSQISEPAYRKIQDSPCNKENSDYSIVKSKLEALCDSESSEDEMEPIIENYDASIEKEKCSTDIKYKANKLGKIAEKKAKEYEEQKLHIQSESQRMQRERNVYLPYHRPKSRSIKEFLEKRPRFTAAFPDNKGKTPAILAIKMTNQNLEKISKKLEEREKMLEDFYKSQSESEEEEIDSNVTNTINKIETENILQVSIERGTTTMYPLIDKQCENGFKDLEICAENEVLQENIIDTENNNATELNSDEITIETTTTSEDNAKLIEIISNIVIPAENRIDNNPSNNELVDYEFSLENIELFENITDLTKPTINDKLYIDKDTTNELAASHINDFSLKKKLNRLQLLKETLGNSIPKLSGDPNEFINLDDDVTPVKGSCGVDKLIERFIEHSRRRVDQKEDSVQIDVLSISHGELHKEVLTMAIHSDSTDDHVAVMETPGAKLKKLRNELQTRMAQRRSEMWKKQKNVLENVPTTDNDYATRNKESYEEGSEYDILDDEEEEFDVEEEEDEDENLVEDDIDMSDKKNRKKSAFIEEEAELSATEDPYAPNDGDDEDENDEDDNNYNEEEIDEDNDCTKEDPTAKEIDTDHLHVPGKKKMRRIITMDDSDDENEHIKSDINVCTPKDKETLDSTNPWEDDDSDSQLVCPNAQRPPSSQRTPQHTDSKSSNSLDFITPVRQLTGLQSMQSFDDETDERQSSTVMPIELPMRVPLMPDPSPLRDYGWQRQLLFPETDGIAMLNMEELATEICSGKFPSSLSEEAITIKNDETNFIKPSFNNDVVLQQSQPSTQDVLDICSGNFTCTTQHISSNKTNNTEINEISINNCLGGGNLSSNSNFEAMQSANYSETEIFKRPAVESLDDDDDKIISQLMDEEEMEKFRKKFESPINEQEKVDVIPSELSVCNRIMFDTSSSDENDYVGKNERKLKVLQKRRKKKCLIDDSDDEERENLEEGNDNVDFENEDDESIESDGNGENIVDYDSEENEVKGILSKPAFQVSDFVENEAELSESDWDSADEDENGLDELDIEAGDDEKFDEQKLRSGIERVQLRQMLDEDNKDLKLLQEMLLEDGELHGTGRERRFKWKNIDNTFDLERGENNENEKDDFDDAADSEELWRKKRHERVLFLKSNTSREKENEDLLSSNSILKLGQKAIVRNANTSQNSHPTTEDTERKNPKINLTVKQPFSLLNKRGSFLTRGEKVLAKVAEFTKTSEKLSAKGPTKFSRNFLFSTVLNDADMDNIKKRKADDVTSVAIKKLRLNNLSPATNRITGKKSFKNIFSNT